MKNEYDQLIQLLEVFVSGQDQTLRHVQKIEDYLATRLQEDDWVYEELGEPVASYRPSGGECLYDEITLTQVFQFVIKKLKLPIKTITS